MVLQHLVILGIKKVFGWKDGDEIIVSPWVFLQLAPIIQHGMKMYLLILSSIV